MEQLQQFLDRVIFIVGNATAPAYTFTFRNLMYLSLVSVIIIILFGQYQKVIKKLTERFNIDPEGQITINRTVRVVMLWVCAILLFTSLGLPFEEITNYEIYKSGCKIVNKEEDCQYIFRVGMIINSILIYFFIRVILWILLQLMTTYYNRKEMDLGSRYAINQLIKYVIYISMILIIIETLGFQLSVIWAGAAALLVGFGLGLQQTFNDLFSGILIMVEGSVHVGDMVRVKGEIGKVTKIGIRASEVRLRDDAELIVPNSHLVMDSIANWNHSDQKARFLVKVGVAYGSDTELVKNILLDVVVKHEKVINSPKPFVRFVDFGNSSLDFELHFWTFDVFGVLNTQSDLRFEIDKAFRKHKIEIPFPQRDLWVRNAKDLK